ncbi:MAG: hydantoinase/oxoprolinase family protein [Alphaproteobacteria bacterium]
MSKNKTSAGAARRPQARLGVDIGGTFTDVALEIGTIPYTAKTLTTHGAPERGVLTGMAEVVAKAGIKPQDVDIIIYGTTLATNMLIERRGAKTALVTTEGFRDSIEMRNENRFEQYDVNIDLPEPLVPRHLRFPIPERLTAQGRVLVPLREDAVEALIPQLEKEGIESIAIGFIHSYAHPIHEKQARDILARRLPKISITLSSDVSPEMREFERFSTACANAYVQPLMSRHLTALGHDLKAAGFNCPLFLMLSGGGITTLDTAIRFPVRLVESGPAGGAIFASHVAHQCGARDVVSYDMGGTTAKICMIDAFQPQTSRTFEVARVYRFMKGSGLPLRIPVIEMVEIGAGGGSLAHIDSLGRIAVGPESAGSEPGPACYGRGGTKPAVTDADVILGKIDPNNFAGGRMTLDRDSAGKAIIAEVGKPLGLELPHAALGVSEMVDENMANAARVHAIESGKDIEIRTLIAFGGAAPIHVSRLAEKLAIPRVIIPTGAGVGSAIGFLRAPVAYEVIRSHHQRLSKFNGRAATALIAEMRAEAKKVVEPGAGGAKLVEKRIAFMRYVGQGHEVAVNLPADKFGADAAKALRKAFETSYKALYDRTIPHLDVEVLTWALLLSTPLPKPKTLPSSKKKIKAKPVGKREIIDQATGRFVTASVYARSDLVPGSVISGPAVIVENDTATVVGKAYDASINGLGYIVLDHRTLGKNAR